MANFVTHGYCFLTLRRLVVKINEYMLTQLILFEAITDKALLEMNAPITCITWSILYMYSVSSGLYMLRPGLQLLARFKTGQPDSKPANPFRNRLGNFTHARSMQHRYSIS